MTQNTSAVTVRLLRPSDLDEISRIHVNAFPDSVLSKVGEEAVRRYYKWQMEGPHEYVALGAARSGRLIAFCFGGIARGALAGFVGQNRWYLVRKVIRRPWLLTNPIFMSRIGLALRLLKRFQIGRESPEGLRPSNKVASFGILAIAVEPPSQGLGVGKLLMESAEASARDRGFLSMHLTVDPHNARAAQFYESLGWVKAETEGRWTGRMEKNLSDGQNA